MERLSALINRLKDSFESGAPKEELLRLVFLLQDELGVSVNSADAKEGPVAVVMPTGYQSFVKVGPNSILEDNATNTHVEMGPTLGIFGPASNGSIQTAPPVQERETERQKLTRPAYSVPMPPRVTRVEEVMPERTEEVNAGQPEEVMEEVLEDVILKTPEPEKTNAEIGQVSSPSLLDEIRGFLQVNGPVLKEPFVAAMDESKGAEEVPLVFELQVKEEKTAEPFRAHTSERVMEIDDILALEMPNEPRPKELHEILAARVVASGGNEPGAVKILSDKLGGSKIADLRRGFAINDRFRFIKSLFRGDETLFDRSVKTINNFNILPEAQYWIQRELVIKLGWNEEDELVQEFYSLVSRRFL